MTTMGVIKNVQEQPLGSELAEPVSAGDTVLLIVDASDFVEGVLVDAGGGETGEVLSGGGIIRVGGEDPNAELVRYETITEPQDDDDADAEPSAGDFTSFGIGGGFGGAEEWDETRQDYGLALREVSDDDDDEVFVGPATITLQSPLTRAWAEGVRVDIWNTGTGSPSVEWRAQVLPTSNTDSTDAIEAVVHWALVPWLPEGVRDDDDAEAAQLENVGGDWMVTNVAGRRPELQPDFTPRGGTPHMSVYAGADGTYTRPDNNPVAFRVRIVGGGGGGGAGIGGPGRACGSGGGSGAYCERWYTAAQLGETAAYQVGAGGTPGSAANNEHGGPGGASTFTPSGTGAAMTAGGGRGGTSDFTSYTGAAIAGMDGGAGGTASGGQLDVDGAPGGPAVWAANTIAFSGAGASSVLGGGADGASMAGQVGQDGRRYGGGGGGGAASTTNAGGGRGAAGVVIIEVFYS